MSKQNKKQKTKNEKRKKKKKKLINKKFTFNIFIILIK